jgi:hypothetical protein
MTGSELASIRKALGLTTTQWGRELGYSGTDASVASSIRRLEARRGRDIPWTVAKLAYMIDRFGDQWNENPYRM